jgi:membrane-bound serine protease (ClpP class)
MTGLPQLLANPDVAVLTLLAGVLLIYFECNRPGSILPGCLGSLFVLLSLNSLHYLPLRPSALALTAIGAALIALAALRLRILFAAIGIASLTDGLATLIQPFASAHVHLSTAIFSATTFGLTTVWLATIALRARSNKRSIRHSIPHPSAAQDRLN